MEKLLADGECHSFYQTYTRHVPPGNVLDHLGRQVSELFECLDGLDESVGDTVHPPYTWTVKQVVAHMIDAEKIFGCRAHRFACKDEQPVPGMEQNGYVEALDFSNVNLESLVDEWRHGRQANLMFLQRIPDSAWDLVGVADENPVTVRALAHILYGHVAHHLVILQQRLQGDS